MVLGDLFVVECLKVKDQKYSVVIIFLVLITHRPEVKLGDPGGTIQQTFGILGANLGQVLLYVLGQTHYQRQVPQSQVRCTFRSNALFTGFIEP